MSLIYCEDCKWHKDVSHFHPMMADDAVFKECCYVIKTEPSPKGRMYFYADCKEDNKNNNCRFYEPKWWKFWKTR